MNGGNGLNSQVSRCKCINPLSALCAVGGLTDVLGPTLRFVGLGISLYPAFLACRSLTSSASS